MRSVRQPIGNPQMSQQTFASLIAACEKLFEGGEMCIGYWQLGLPKPDPLKVGDLGNPAYCPNRSDFNHTAEAMLQLRYYLAKRGYAVGSANEKFDPDNLPAYEGDADKCLPGPGLPTHYIILRVPGHTGVMVDASNRRMGRNHGQGIKLLANNQLLDCIPHAIGTHIVRTAFRAAIPTVPAARKLLPNTTFKALPPAGSSDS